MNKLTVITFLSVFFLSCSTFVNLGDSETSSNNSDSLPEELSDNENYEDEGDNYGDNGDSAGDTGNSGDTGDTGDSGNSGNTGETNDMTDGSVSDEDFMEFSDEDIPTDGYPFDKEFSSEDCSCGDDPVYAPVCCDETTSVFNKCFANCYNIHSDGMICNETVEGVCDKVEYPDTEASDNEINDIDNEVADVDNSQDVDVVDDMDSVSDIDSVTDMDAVNDSDVTEIIDNECGCYPNDTGIYCCYVNGTVLVSKCMAECICAGGYSNCY